MVIFYIAALKVGTAWKIEKKNPKYYLTNMIAFPYVKITLLSVINCNKAKLSYSTSRNWRAILYNWLTVMSTLFIPFFCQKKNGFVCLFVCLFFVFFCSQCHAAIYYYLRKKYWIPFWKNHNKSVYFETNQATSQQLCNDPTDDATENSCRQKKQERSMQTHGILPTGSFEVFFGIISWSPGGWPLRRSGPVLGDGWDLLCWRL